MIATVPSATVLGVDGYPVSVEVHVGNGLPGFTIVGLPDAACRESRDRVRAALASSSLPWPTRKITVNLAPSTLRKAGGGLDVPIAVGLLVAGDAIGQDVIDGCAFIGELGLDGSIRAVPGMVPLVDALAASTVIVPWVCWGEAALVGRHVVRGVRSIGELVRALLGEEPWPDPPRRVPAPAAMPGPDLSDVRGQLLGRWAIEVAAAGGHHVLLTGPPGAGKTLLARRLPSLLPSLDPREALETTRIHSAAGLTLPPEGLVRVPPFRAPHHGASSVALVGGGNMAMRPGEISLAHNGVLFLDELAEFPPSVLDALRQPLEEGVVRVSRARASVAFPARFLLVGAMNPCPCGEGGAPGSCRCSEGARARYGRRLSGPLLDRFDLRVPVMRPDVMELLGGRPGESSSAVAGRVAAARELAVARGVACNALLPGPALEALAPITDAASRLLEHRLRRGALSARGLHRVRRIARTLADLDGQGGVIGETYVCAALELRVEPTLLGMAS